MTHSGSRLATRTFRDHVTLALCISIGLIEANPGLAQPPAQNVAPQALFDTAIDDFINGDIQRSANGFDALIDLVPSFAPRLWQRGIVLYYAGRYDDCIEQFELHRTVNPNDVENATWHFLCVARAQSPEAARNALLPVGPDSRVPMRRIYELFAGETTPDDVLAAAAGRPRAVFYAHLYLGLHAEALGNEETALQHIRAAAAEDNARVGGYMHTVARVHLAVRGERTR